MKIVHAEHHRAHQPRFFVNKSARTPNPESPERADILLAAALAAGHTPVPPGRLGQIPRETVHDRRYLSFLEGAWGRWRHVDPDASEIIPNVHPNGRPTGGYPASVEGQAGYHMADTACPISAGTFAAACVSTDLAATAAALVLRGDPVAYALCRPPGHHASSDTAAGFCFLNNAAIAAEVLRSEHRRVAILDIDLHHGNGTQQIFYSRSDVMTVSIHADPSRFYPFFWGYASERGEGDGSGCNLNIPIERASGDEVFLKALDQALAAISGFSPSALVLALGLDASEADPFGGLRVTTSGFSRIGGMIGGAGFPMVLVQEGGYVCPSLGDNLTAILNGIEGNHRLRFSNPPSVSASGDLPC